MAIRIIKPSDPMTVQNVVGTLYGAPGTLKTSILSTADAPVVLDFDKSAHRAMLREADIVQLDSWADAGKLDREFYKPYKTVGVDTVGRLGDCIAQDLMRSDAKLGYQGALSLQGYGRLGAAFNGWLALLKSYGLDIILLSHVSEETKGDEVIERLDTPGKMMRQEVYKVSDFMGRLAMRQGKLTLLFSPSDTSYGKNPAQFDPLIVPDLNANRRFLAEIIEKTKAHLNRQSEEQQQVTLMLTEWREQVSKATTAGAFTKLVEVAGTLPANVQKAAKAALNDAAKAAGCTWDKTNKAFTEAPAKGDAAQQELV